MPAKAKSAKDTVAAMEPSWNLGNTLDAFPNETSWGNPLTTRAHLAKIRSEGFRSVRIPVTWTDHQSATAPYAVDATYMDRVEEVTDFALAEGLYVVLNVRHDSWQWVGKMSTDHGNVMARFNSLWTQISSTFKDKPRTLLFQSINEPEFENATDEQKATFLNELNTSFHKIVRGSGGQNTDRLLMLPTIYCKPDQPLMDALYNTIKSLNDPNLVATVHYYSWFPFSVNIAGGTHYDETARKDLDGAFQRMRDTFVARGIPVYLGEYGLLSWPDHHPSRLERGEALKYFEHLGHAARQAGVTTAQPRVGARVLVAPAVHLGRPVDPGGQRAAAVRPGLAGVPGTPDRRIHRLAGRHRARVHMAGAVRHHLPRPRFPRPGGRRDDRQPGRHRGQPVLRHAGQPHHARAAAREAAAAVDGVRGVGTAPQRRPDLLLAPGGSRRPTPRRSAAVRTTGPPSTGSGGRPRGRWSRAAPA